MLPTRFSEEPKKISKVLAVLPSYDVGGAEKYCLRLIRHSQGAGLNWYVTTGNRKNAKLEGEFVAAGAVAHRFSTGYASPAATLRFRRFLGAEGFDAVMTFTGVFGGPALFLARKAGVPTRIAWHRRSTPAHSQTLARRLYSSFARRLLERSATSILSNSITALDQFHGAHWRSDDRFRVIRNGVDFQRFRPDAAAGRVLKEELKLPASCSVVGHVGRFDPAKDHETLFATVRRVLDAGASIRLLVAGTGTDSSSFQDRLRAHGLNDFTCCLGAREDVERLYRAMDIFLFPSVTEGQPNALIEAMLSGVKIIASDISPIREAVPEFLFGHLFPPGDSVAAAALLSSALEDGQGPDGRVRDWAVDRYDLRRNLDSVLEVMGL